MLFPCTVSLEPHYLLLIFSLNMTILSKFEITELERFHGIYRTCKQGTLIPPQTWSCPIWDLHMFLYRNRSLINLSLAEHKYGNLMERTKVCHLYNCLLPNNIHPEMPGLILQSLLTCHIRRKCSMETSRNLVKVKFGIKVIKLV